MQFQKDWRSKWFDGIGTALMMFLASILIEALVPPIEIMIGRPGVLIFSVVLIALGVLFLERSLTHRIPEPSRALYGIAGGVITWAVIYLSNGSEVDMLIGDTGMLTLVMVTLITLTLWKRFLPLGMKYFMGTMLFGWAAYVLISWGKMMATQFPQFLFLIPVTGYIACALAVGAVIWLFTKSENRLNRLWQAVYIWTCLLVVVYVFRGLS